MTRHFSKLLPVAVALVVMGAVGFSEEKAEEKKPVLRLKNVRTTAYTHTEADHVKYGNKNGARDGAALHAGVSFGGGGLVVFSAGNKI